jgi:Na+/proline symporter
MGAIPTGVIGIIVIAFSLAAFFLLDIETSAVNVWALTFLLLSECVLFGGLMGLQFLRARHSNVFLRTGTATALFLYFAATVISVFFAGLFKEKLNTFILIELTIIALFAIVAISVFAFSRMIEHRSEEDTLKVGSNEPKRGGF